MIRLKINLKPKKSNPINLSYKYYLADICNSALEDNIDDFKERLEKYNKSNSNKASNLFSFTQFFCTQYEIKGTKILFKDVVNWYISSPIYELILHLVQKFNSAGKIKIGKEEFEVIGIEATETADVTVMELNKELFSFNPNKNEDIYEKLSSYYILSEDEKII